MFYVRLLGILEQKSDIQSVFELQSLTKSDQGITAVIGSAIEKSVD